MASNWQRGNTPKPGDRITSRSFGDLSNAITGSRRAASVSAPFGIQAAGGFVEFPLAVRRSSPSAVAAWPFKVYGTSVTTTGQVQINGRDGFAPTLNGVVANVNGSPADTPLSGPPNVYPQLAVTGNGVIYGYVVPATPGTASPFTSFDIFYAGTIPDVDTASPATYYPFLIATITGYTTDGSGNVSFTVSNVTTAGWTTLIYCNGVIQIYG